MVGVTVIEKGTNNATITDNDGDFEIEVDKNAVLVFSFVAYIPMELPAGTDMVVYLKEDVLNIDAVIVTAYGRSQRASYTGSASVIKSEKLEKLQVSSVSQALQGSASGIQVVSGNGQPGSNATIRIRGISSINGVSDPLYVVDGAPYGGYINAINPNDIESITVLKDASATALYGSRAAGGVILITTKKGEAGKTKFNLSSSFGVSGLAVKFHEVVNPEEYYELAWEAIRNGQMDNGFTLLEANQNATDNLIDYVKVNAYDITNPVGQDGKLLAGANYLWPGNSWNDAIFSTKFRREYNASVSHSNDVSSYYISLGYLDDESTLTVSKFERFSGRINVQTNATDWLKVGMNSSFSSSLTNSPDQGRVIRFLRNVPDLYPVYEWDAVAGDFKTDINGDKILDFGAYRPSAAWPNANPLAEAKYDQSFFENDNLTTRFSTELKLPLGIVIMSNLSVDYSVASGFYYYNNTYGWAAQIGGRSSRDRNRFFVYTFNNLATWNKSIKKNHITVLLGHEAYKNRADFLSGTKEMFPLESMYELDGAATLVSASSRQDYNSIEGWLAKVDYDYQHKYYLSGSFRRDGSSRFAKGKRWGNFWSVGASWRLSEESFLSGVDWINSLKLKANYGLQGNDNIGSLYAYQGLYNAGWSDASNPGYLVGSLPNPALRWESNEQLSIGVDARLFERMDFTLEWYNRTTYDLLFWRDLPPSSGVVAVADNIGDMRNRGIEFQIKTVNILSTDFRWETDFNISNNINEILSLPVKEKVNGNFKWVTGRSVYDFFLPEWAGVDATTGTGYFWKDVHDIDENGDFILDEEGNRTVVGRIKVDNSSEATRYFLGSALPDVFGGLTNSFYYRNFDLSVFLYFSLGGKVYDADYANLMHAGGIGLNWSKDIKDRWTPLNPTTNVPRLTTGSNDWNTASSRFLYDATNMRLRNITLGYTLPEELTRKLSVSTLRVYLRGDNMFTWFKQKGMDPDQSITGVAVNNLTSMKTMSFGLEINF